MTLQGQQDYSGVSPKFIDHQHQASSDSLERQKRAKPSLSPLNGYILAIQNVLIEEVSNKKLSGAIQVAPNDKVPGFKPDFNSSFAALRQATNAYAKIDIAAETQDNFYDESQKAKFLAQWKAKRKVQAEVILKELKNLENKWKVLIPHQSSRPSQEFKRMRHALEHSINEGSKSATVYKAVKK